MDVLLIYHFWRPCSDSRLVTAPLINCRFIIIIIIIITVVGGC